MYYYLARLLCPDAWQILCTWFLNNMEAAVCVNLNGTVTDGALNHNGQEMKYNPKSLNITHLMTPPAHAIETCLLKVKDPWYFQPLLRSH